MSSIREDMPLFVRNEGEWDCLYTFVDLDHNVLDQYRVHIICEFPDEDDVAYRQTSTNRWPDGREETTQFEARYDAANKRVTWDNDRMKGALWEVDDMTIYLSFAFHAMPDVRVCEMIQLSACGQHRTRTWHWFRNDALYQRTLVKEKRIAS